MHSLQWAQGSTIKLRKSLSCAPPPLSPPDPFRFPGAPLSPSTRKLVHYLPCCHPHGLRSSFHGLFWVIATADHSWCPYLDSNSFSNPWQTLPLNFPKHWNCQRKQANLLAYFCPRMRPRAPHVPSQSTPLSASCPPAWAAGSLKPSATI